MPEDASLDAFAAAEADDRSEDDGSEDDGAEIDEEAAETDSAESVEPATSTYAWSPEGDECADCGESVSRRWRAEGQRGGDLVCVDCKDW